MSFGHIDHNGYSYRNFLDETGLLGTAREVMANITQQAAYSTSDSGRHNDLFGAALYVQTNLENNGYGSLPKMDMTGANVQAEQPLPLSWRAAYNPPSLQSVGEGANLPSPRDFDTQEVSAEIKTSEAVIGITHLSQLRAELLDGVPFDELTRVDELFQELAIDRDGVMQAVSANNSGYSSRTKITELDRIIASSGEESNADDTSGTAFSDGDLDVYDIDRSADTWADAYVDHNSASGDRQLTETLMDQFLASYFDFGSASRENVFILTGRNTARVLGELQSDSTDGVQAVVNYDPSDIGRDSVEDAETVMGVPTMTKSRHYKGIPIVSAQNAPADSLERIYMVPTDEVSLPGGISVPRIGVGEYSAPHYEELTGDEPENAPYLSQGQRQDTAYYLMDHEIECHDFSSTGKLRDLQE